MTDVPSAGDPPHAPPPAAPPVPPVVAAPAPTRFGPALSTPVSTPVPEGADGWAPGLAGAGDASIGRPAGFWRRAWARVVTTYVWSLASAAITVLISSLTLYITSSTDDDVVAAVGGVLAFAANVVVFALVWVRPLHQRGATVGMRQLGLELHIAGSPARPRSGTTWLRSAVAFLPSLVAGAVPYAYALSGSDAVALGIVIALLATTALTVLGALWSLVSGRRQTLWDVVAGTEVTVRQRPSWVALVAFLLGTTIPTVAAFTFRAIGSDEIRDALESSSGLSDLVDLLGPALPALIVSAVTIAVSLVALRSTAWDVERRAGRGLAQTGLFLGWAIPAAIVVGVLFSFVYRQISSTEEDRCDTERERIEEAITSYRTLNGIEPTLGDLSDPIYLDDATLDERWRLAAGRLGPVGDCRPD